ncbi:hypothetical protein VFPFJ_04076 [Purpureocillium lilacinum]|uniref:Uncharacterized protein n=1 Tax=Purpureocillium lilacinum TaxID=33203 RepID=A0A179HPG7_PURLI|nr:hypothetical protein VFPFJ_04076 [Purpureocillium lilacinum]OAQ82296.1 hypothetical protein VFPBJ_04880 [Purpureocillium lilacinum]OAQ92336.1 hypothetical protein VFPFJ_04076 [Purpureocillium lilacinum]
MNATRRDMQLPTLHRQPRPMGLSASPAREILPELELHLCHDLVRAPRAIPRSETTTH